MAKRIGVVGGGIMGSGIAEACARANATVLLVERDAAQMRDAQRRIERSLERVSRSGRLTGADAQAALSRIDFDTGLDGLADRELVLEAVTEDEAVKVAVFRDLDRVVQVPEAVLGSNTSSIPIMKLAVSTSRPEQVCGLHFFNPVPVMNLVELVPSLVTSEETTRRCERFVTEVLKKRAIRCEDRAGFVVNSLLIPYLLAAIRMYESGFATAEDIDTGMVEGCGHPMGPLALCDLIGLDTVAAVAESLYDEFKEPLFASPPLLSRMVDAGLLGRKSGRGFYDHSAR
jgi:3-hydroxybutyryl-CoA dehydrogenase